MVRDDRRHPSPQTCGGWSRLDCGGGSWSGGRSSSRGVLLGEGAGLLVDTAVLREGNVEAVVIPAAGEDQEGPRGDGDEQEVENTVEDERRRDANVVAAVRDTPGNGVQEPEEVDPAGKERVVAGDAQALGADGAVAEGVHGEEDPGGSAECVEAPLVVGGGESADEVGDDPDPGQEDLVDDGGPGDAAQQAEGDDQDGELDDPEDILRPENLPVAVVDVVCCGDDLPPKVGSLCEVDDGASSESNDEEVVEDAFTTTGKPDEAGNDKLRGFELAGMIDCMLEILMTYP